MQRPQHMLPQLPLFQQCSIQSEDVMQTWLHWTQQLTCSTCSERFPGSLSPKPNECLHFDLESCNLMCTYIVVTDPCHIPPLAQARSMMLCIYTSSLSFLYCCIRTRTARREASCACVLLLGYSCMQETAHLMTTHGPYKRLAGSVCV